MTTPDELTRKAHDLEPYLPVNSDIPSISPDYARIQTPLMWGGIWQAPGLDLKLRSFATISAQCVNGWDFGLQHQIRVGLTMGMTPQQIKGIFIQLLFYAGIPATVHGLLQAQTVISEREDWKAADVPWKRIGWTRWKPSWRGAAKSAGNSGASRPTVRSRNLWLNASFPKLPTS